MSTRPAKAQPTAIGTISLLPGGSVDGIAVAVG